MQLHNKLIRSVILCVAAGLLASQAAEAEPSHDLATLGRLVEQAADYDYGKSRAVLFEIERVLPRLIGTPEQRSAEQRLIAGLPKAGPGLREFLCRQLAYVGGDASVEPLVSLLTNADASGIAIHALAQISGESVARRLRESLARMPDQTKTGIVFILGERKDQASLPILTGFMTGSNAELAASAALAVGKLGTTEALQALASARNKTSGALRKDIIQAQLLCAGLLATSGKASEARAFYAELRDLNVEPESRAAGLRALILTEPAQAGKQILAALQSKNEALIPMAVSLADRVSSEGELMQIAQAMPSLSANNQMRLLGALERSGSRAVVPVVVEALKSPSEEVKIVALRTLAVLGDGSAVAAVTTAAGSGSEAVQAVARQTLERMPGPGVNQRIVEMMGSAAPAAQIPLVMAAGARGIADALPALRKAVAGSDAALRAEAIQSLGKIGLPEDQRTLVTMLISAPGRELEDAIVAIGTREKTADAVVAAAESTQDPNAKVALMQALGRLGDKRGLVMIQDALGSSDWATRTGAVRALAQWPSLLPLEQLWQIAVTDDDLPRHSSALSGYIRMLVDARNRPEAERVALIEKAISIARRPDEKRQAITALAEMPSLEALHLALTYYPVEELRPVVQAVVGRIAMRWAGPGDYHVLESLLGLRIYTSSWPVSRTGATPAPVVSSQPGRR